MIEEIVEMLKRIRPDIDFYSANGLLTEEILDSFDIIAILAAIFDKYNIDVNLDDINEEYFDNLDGIVMLIKKYYAN